MKMIYPFIVLLFVCCNEDKSENNLESIYDFNNNQITGKDTSVNISISDKNKIIYNIKCDSLVNTKEKIYLYDNVILKFLIIILNRLSCLLIMRLLKVKLKKTEEILIIISVRQIWLQKEML